jgi:uncharacterized protein (TIGR02453 family)
MEQLLAELAPQFGQGRVYRPYRDVRFSRDKTPYKTTISASLERGYISLSADGLDAGTGMYMPAADQLERYRRAVAEDATGAQIDKLGAKLTKAGIELTAHEVLKTVPRGYPKDHPRAELLKLKGLVTWQHWPVEPWLFTNEAKRKIVAFLKACAPVERWLAENVGPSDLPVPERR